MNDNEQGKINAQNNSQDERADGNKENKYKRSELVKNLSLSISAALNSFFAPEQYSSGP